MMMPPYELFLYAAAPTDPNAVEPKLPVWIPTLFGIALAGATAFSMLVTG